MSEPSLKTDAAQALSNLHDALVPLTRRLSNSRGASEADTIPAERLRGDLVALALSISQHATKLGIASKPPISGDRGWEAVKGVTAAIADLAAKCGFATSKLGASYLAKELRWTSTDLLEAVQNLVGVLGSALRATATISSQAREGHLSLIGIIWKCSEKLAACSSNEAEALSRALTSEIEIMDDGLVECRDLLEATGSISSDRESDEEDREALSDLERRRVENAIRLLVSARRLVRRIIALLKRQPLPVVDGKPADLARVHSLVSSLVASQDDLVSTLPGPQDVVELRTYATAVLEHAQALAGLAIELWPPDPGRPDVEALISELTLDDRGSDKSVSFGTIGDQLKLVGTELGIV